MFIQSVVMVLLIAGGHQVQSRDIAFTGKSVILTCPGNPVFKWFGGGEDKHVNETYEIVTSSGQITGQYTCQTERKSYHFYIHAKVCQNCHELSGLLASAVIFGDLLITGGVILIVYLCATRKGSNSQQRVPNQRSAAPRPPNPDYEPLNPKTQNKDVYAGIR